MARGDDATGKTRAHGVGGTGRTRLSRQAMINPPQTTISPPVTVTQSGQTLNTAMSTSAAQTSA